MAATAELLSYRSYRPFHQNQDVTTPAEAWIFSPVPPPSCEENNHRPLTPRRCAVAPATDRMASPADKGEDPWNDNTKEKFNRLVATPRFFPLKPVGLPVTDLLPSPPSSKSKSKWLDPCQEAASKSIKCLNRNGGDKAMCQDYFECVSHEQAGLVDWAGLGRRRQG